MGSSLFTEPIRSNMPVSSLVYPCFRWKGRYSGTWREWMDGWTLRRNGWIDAETCRYTKNAWSVGDSQFCMAFGICTGLHLLWFICDYRRRNWREQQRIGGKERELVRFRISNTNRFLFSWLSTFSTLLLSTKSAPTSSRDSFSLPTPTLWMSSALVRFEERLSGL